MEEGEVPPWTVDEIDKKDKVQEIQEFLDHQGLKREPVPGTSKQSPTEASQETTAESASTAVEEAMSESDSALQAYKARILISRFCSLNWSSRLEVYRTTSPVGYPARLFTMSDWILS